MSVAYQYIDPEACMHCLGGQSPHQSWHATRADYLKIGHEYTERWRENTRTAVKQATDEELVGFGTRVRRMLAVAVADAWDEAIADIVREWVELAEKEWRWRKRAAGLGADAVRREGASWADRVDEVKRQTDLGMLIAYECIPARPVGTRGWKVACPFHDDRHPSMDVDTVKNVWICRSCGVGGDAITYAELRYRLSFVDAVEHLEARLGIKRPDSIRPFPRGGRRPLGAAIPV